MAKDLTVMLENRPGTLAHMAEALGKAGVNIEGVCALPSGEQGPVHVLVEDANAARRALEAAEIHVHEERDVLVLNIEDRPGELGKLCRKIANAGANINLCYLATNTRIVIGADDLDKARAAVQA